LSYFVLCYALTQLAHYLERRVTHKRAGKGNKTRPGAEQPLLEAAVSEQ
jgi:polar amino acid transport system permease protein